MPQIRHFINGQDFGEPRNWEDLEITIDWLNKKESGTINVSDLEFVNEANEYLQSRIMDGINGGVGVFEGEPYTIEVKDFEENEYIFKGYLDFTENLNLIGGEETICSLKKIKGDDWLNDVADTFSFAYLYEQGVIKKSDFVKVPYVINYVPDGLQLVVLSISLFMMTKELIQNIESLAETAGDVVDAATPVVGASVGAGAGVVTAWDIGNFILVIIKAIARIAYIIAIVVAIKNLIEQLFEQLLPKKRNHLGMRFRTLMERGCEYLGMRFVSSIPELNIVHIPTKNKKGGEKGEVGFPSNTGPVYLFGDTIRILKEMFNADYRIIDDVFYFERRDSFKIKSPYKIPSFFNNQERLLDVFNLNTDEILANYNINYSLDIQDQNTLDVAEGRVFQAITTPLSKRNKDLVTIKNIKEVSIPFSLGLEKRSLNNVEELAKKLGSIVDDITSIFGGGTNFESKIENRIGSLLLSSHFLTVGKLVDISGSNLKNNQRSILDAKNLWNNYHYINSFAEYKGEHNQFFIYEQQPVSMSFKEFILLLESQEAVDHNGNECFIQKVVYNPYKTTALIDYRVKKKYTNNLKIEII